MASRGRGRGRGFGRGKPFGATDQLNPLPAKKVSSAQLSPYPPLEFYPAQLSTEKYYDDLLQIRDLLLVDFQASNYYLKQEDENLKLFSSGGEQIEHSKPTQHFHWNYLPLELRLKDPNSKKVSKTKQNKQDSKIDLSW